MSAPTVIAIGAGEIVGDSPDRRVEILSDHDAVHVTWSRFGPRRDGADLHIHRRHTDLFYVLEGELTLRLGLEGETVRIPAGRLARVPRLVVHGFRNEGDEEVRYLNLHAPGQGFAQFMRAARDGRPLTYDQEPPPPDGARPTREAVVGATGSVVERPGVRVTLLADVEEIAVAEVMVEPGDWSGSAHVHRGHVESLYVLEGELSLVAGARRLAAPAGSWVQVPPGVPHAVSFPGSAPVRFLEAHTPGSGFGRYLDALGLIEDEVLAAARAGFDQQPVA
jgi:mannose-6-phosphate isomerase-like protein (cupin superfamily)